MPHLEFIFDFASPNAYMAHKALGPILERTGASVTYNPCLLGGIFKSTGNQAPMIAFGPIKGKLAYEQLEIMRFIKKHGLTAFKMNPHFPVNTLMLMRAAVSLQDKPEFNTFIKAGMKAMWEDGVNMSDPESFTNTLSEAGLDGAALLAATQDPEVKARLMRNTAGAVERGVFGIPTFFVGDAMFFGKDRLNQVEAELSR